MYYIYHIFGKKIGVTRNLNSRVTSQQGYKEDEYEVLETSDDIDYVSDRELELQSIYGYKVDRQSYKNLTQKQSNKMQLNVTGLQLCDYVEASFESVYNGTVKKKDGVSLYHGYIALMRYEKPTNGQEFYYIYSPVNSDASWSPIVDSEEDLIEIIPWNLYKWKEQIIERKILCTLLF